MVLGRPFSYQAQLERETTRLFQQRWLNHVEKGPNLEQGDFRAGNSQMLALLGIVSLSAVRRIPNSCDFVVHNH